MLFKGPRPIDNLAKLYLGWWPKSGRDRSVNNGQFICYVKLGLG